MGLREGRGLPSCVSEPDVIVGGSSKPALAWGRCPAATGGCGGHPGVRRRRAGFASCDFASLINRLGVQRALQISV